MLGASLWGCSQQSPVKNASEAHTADLFAMDTYMTLKAYGDNAEKALTSATNRITELEGMLDVTSPSSDVYKLDNANGNALTVSPDTASIIATGIEYGRLTDGDLDISIYPVLKEWGFTTGEYKVPDKQTIDSLLADVDYSRITVNGDSVTVPEDMQIDLGSLAKGYTSDAVMEIFREEGVKSAIVSLGGNVQAIGKKPDGSDWSVAVVNPFAPDTDMCIVEIDEKAVITSGNYERYFTDDEGNNYWHIIDPKDGCPADNGLVSVTIIGDRGIMCDALSTALFAAGTEKAVSYWQNDKGFDMILVTDEGQILYTPELSGHFRNVSNMPAEVISVA